MPNYQITTPGGRTIKFASNSNLSEEDIDEIIAMDAGAGSQQLADFTGKGKNTKQERSELKDYISRSLGVSADQFDETKGADAGLRSLVGFLPTNGEKVSALQGKFGQNNVKPLRFGGEDRIAYRDDQDGKFRLFDEQGISFKDFTADWLGGAAPLAASVVAGTAAAAATIGSGGLAAPLAIGAASGATHALTGFLQDTAARQIGGFDQQYGESIKRRGKEGLFTAGADALTAGLARPIARAWGDRAVGAGSRKISDLMSKYGDDFDSLPASVRGTESEAVAGMRRSSSLPSGREARQLSELRDRLPRSIDELRGQYGGSADDTIKYVSDVQARTNKIVNDARAADFAFKASERGLKNAQGSAKLKFKESVNSAKKKSVKDQLDTALAMRNQIDSQLEKVVKGRQARFTSGEEIRSLRIEGQRLANERVGGLYDEAYRLADVASSETNPIEVSSMIEKSLSKAGYELDETGQIAGRTLETMKETFGDKLAGIHNKFLRRSETRGTENMPFSELDQYVKDMGNSVNWNRIKSRKTSSDERSMVNFYEDMVALRDKKLKDAGKPAYKKYYEAKDAYKDEVRPFVDDKTLSSSLDEPVKGSNKYSKAGEDVFEDALRSNQAAVAAIKHSASPETTRKILQRGLMNKLLPKQTGGSRKPINLSPDDLQMMKTLFGKGKAGWTSERSAVNSLNKLINKYGDISSTFTPEDAVTFVAKKTVKEQKALEKSLEKKLIKNATEKKTLSDNLVKSVNNKSIEMPSDVNELVESVLNSSSTPSEVAEFMGKFTDPKAAEGFRRSAFDNILNESGWDSPLSQRAASGGNDLPLWEPASLTKILRRGADGKPATKKGRNYLEVLGEEAFEKLELYNELLTRSAKITKDNGGSIGRLVGTLGESGIPKLLIVSAAPFTAVGKRLMGVLNTSNLLEPYLRSFTNPKTIDPTALKVAMASLLSTQKGMNDLQDAGVRDPEFKEWVSEYYNSVYVPNQPQAPQ